MSFRILIVEDDPSIANLISVTLAVKSYESVMIQDGAEAAALIQSEHFDLALLDIMLPGLDGYALLAQMQKAEIPVIFISARTTLNEKVFGLNLGAEDYITKPFEPLELLARVDAALRRIRPDADSDIYALKDIQIHIKSRTVLKSGTPIELPRLEYALLEFLIKNPNLVFSREQLLDRVWGYDYEGGTRTVDMHIKNLRSRLDLTEEIMTVYKIGYKLNAEVKQIHE